MNYRRVSPEEQKALQDKASSFEIVDVEEFWDRIYKSVEEHNYNLGSVGKAAGYTYGNISLAKSQKTFPRVDNAIRLAIVLDKTVEELFRK